MIDLNALKSKSAAETGATLVLKHPATNKPTDAKLTVLGKDSQTYQAGAHRIANARINEAQASRKGKVKLDIAEIQTEERELLASCVTGWTGLGENGSELPYTPEAALKLLTDHPWILEQVADFVEDRANFLGK